MHKKHSYRRSKGHTPPVNQQKSNTLKNPRFRPIPNTLSRHFQNTEDNFNFGLYFNKGLYAEWKTAGTFEFPAYPFETGKQTEEVIQRYEHIKDLFSELLQHKHRELGALYQAFEKVGYKPFVQICELKTPLIIGLGNAHPTERGFTFHWTLGVPYIPAESIKGVMRLAYLVEKAQENPDFFEHWAQEDEIFWNTLSQPFGRMEKEGKPAQRGKVVFLDALPTEFPKLTLEITTCHYPEYYEGRRGPTEDQHPRPLPFLAITPGSKFCFTMLIHQDLKGDLEKRIKEAFSSAITEHGFGAKTALGHGRFKS